MKSNWRRYLDTNSWCPHSHMLAHFAHLPISHRWEYTQAYNTQIKIYNYQQLLSINFVIFISELILDPLERSQLLRLVPFFQTGHSIFSWKVTIQTSPVLCHFLSESFICNNHVNISTWIMHCVNSENSRFSETVIKSLKNSKPQSL